MTVVTILALIALVLVIVSLFKPEYPLVAVALLLVCTALLVPVFVRH